MIRLVPYLLAVAVVALVITSVAACADLDGLFISGAIVTLIFVIKAVAVEYFEAEKRRRIWDAKLRRQERDGR